MIIVHAVFSVICYCILLNIYMEVFCTKREIGRWRQMGIIVSMVLLNVIFILGLYNHFILKEICVVFGSSLFMWWLYNVKYLKTLALTAIYVCASVAADYILMIGIMKALPNRSLDLLSSAFGSSLVELLSESIHLILVLILVRCFKKNTSELLTTKEWLRFTIVPVITLVIIMTLVAEFDVAQKNSQEMVFLLIGIGLVVMNIIIYFLLNDVLIREAELRKERLVQLQTRHEIQIQHYLLENYEKQRRLQHEYKNQMTSITALLSEGEYGRLIQYVQNINQKEISMINVIDTNNVMVNAVLNVKYREMMEKGIGYVPLINDLSGIPVSDEDIVVLLSNLLNNAIEACESIEKKVIKMKFVCEGGRMILSISNPYSDMPIIEDGYIRTSKKEQPELHGIGILNVKDIVNKYGGDAVITIKNQEFQFVVIIPMIE